MSNFLSMLFFYHSAISSFVPHTEVSAFQPGRSGIGGGGSRSSGGGSIGGYSGGGYYRGGGYYPYGYRPYGYYPYYYPGYPYGYYHPYYYYGNGSGWIAVLIACLLIFVIIAVVFCILRCCRRYEDDYEDYKDFQQPPTDEYQQTSYKPLLSATSQASKPIVFKGFFNEQGPFGDGKNLRYCLMINEGMLVEEDVVMQSFKPQVVTKQKKLMIQGNAYEPGMDDGAMAVVSGTVLENGTISWTDQYTTGQPWTTTFSGQILKGAKSNTIILRGKFQTTNGCLGSFVLTQK